MRPNWQIWEKSWTKIHFGSWVQLGSSRHVCTILRVMSASSCLAWTSLYKVYLCWAPTDDVFELSQISCCFHVDAPLQAKVHSDFNQDLAFGFPGGSGHSTHIGTWDALQFSCSSPTQCTVRGPQFFLKGCLPLCYWQCPVLWVSPFICLPSFVSLHVSPKLFGVYRSVISSVSGMDFDVNQASSLHGTPFSADTTPNISDH